MQFSLVNYNHIIFSSPVVKYLPTCSIIWVTAYIDPAFMFQLGRVEMFEVIGFLRRVDGRRVTITRHPWYKSTQPRFHCFSKPSALSNKKNLEPEIVVV